MIAEVISTFRGEINGIVFLHEEWYLFIEHIIGEIEDKTNIEVPFSFIWDVKQAFQDYFGYDANFEHIYEDTSRFLHLPTNNIKDLNFIFDYSDKFDEINQKVKNWDNTYGKEPEL